MKMITKYMRKWSPWKDKWKTKKDKVIIRTEDDEENFDTHYHVYWPT